MSPFTESDDAHQDALNSVLLDALLRDTTLAVAASDADGTITMMSPALEALVNNEFTPVRVEDVPERFRVFTEDGSRLLTADEEPVNRARQGESFRGAVMSVHTHDGHFIHLRCSGTPLRDPDGRILGGIAIFDDITAERAVLREQTALRDRLVETVNHQLRTPLTSLLGHAELLEDLLPDLPDWAVRSLNSVIASGRRLNDLVRAVSDLVDLDAAQDVECSAVDVTELVSRCLDRAGELATTHGVELVLVAGEQVGGEVDPHKFSAAVYALVNNAVTHSPPGAQVEVEVSVVDGQVRVDVTDAGPGIPPSERQRLLLPFERGSSSLTAPTGRGLGLALAHAVAVAHRGTIEFHDNSPTGLTVRVEVPQPC